MSVHAASRATFDLTERQQAFVGLLTTPLVTPGATPDLHRLVVRHASHLQVWAQRLGYRLVSVGSVHRLRRIPLPGSAAVPAGPHPPRRVLVLALPDSCHRGVIPGRGEYLCWSAACPGGG